MNDAETLEELAHAAGNMSVLPRGTELDAVAHSAEVLRQQVRAAAGHLALRRRLEARASVAGGSLWAL